MLFFVSCLTSFLAQPIPGVVGGRALSPARVVRALVLASSLLTPHAQKVKEYNLWVCPHCEEGVKSADVTDLSCEAEPHITQSNDRRWPWAKRAVNRFLDNVAGSIPGEEQELTELINFASSSPPSECYLGMVTLGFLSLQFMESSDRYNFMRDTIWGGVTFQRTVPLSYWDVLQSGWPLFSVLALASGVIQNEFLTGHGTFPPGTTGLTGIELGPHSCCDFADGKPGEDDKHFLEALYKNLGASPGSFLQAGSLLPTRIALEYLAGSAHNRYSWGRATAYFALAENVLDSVKSLTPAARQSANSLVRLGEHTLAGSNGAANTTIYHLMLSRWPFWNVMGRLERKRMDMQLELLAPAGPGVKTGVSRPPAPSSAVRFKWRNMLAREKVASYAAAGETASPTFGQPGSSTTARCPSAVHSMANTQEQDVHVALSADVQQIDGLIVAMHSAAKNAQSNRPRLCFHVFVLPEEQTYVENALSCAFGGNLTAVEGHPHAWLLLGQARVLVHTVNSSYVWARIGIQRGSWESNNGSRGFSVGSNSIDQGALTSDTGNLGAVHNFIRFVLHELLPDLPRIVYLDVDVQVKGDLSDLYDNAGDAIGTIAAVPRQHQSLLVYVDVLQPLVPTWIPSEAPSFNAGVLVIDLVRWRERRIVTFVAKWLAANARKKIWMHGSQPPLLILFHDELAPLRWTWNVDGLGHRLNYPKEVLKDANILHWTGPLKPWRNHGVNRLLWEKDTAEYCPQYSKREHTTTCRPDSWFC